MLYTLGIVSSLNAQNQDACSEQSVFGGSSGICEDGIGLIQGQSFFCPDTGWVESITIAHCQSGPTQFVIKSKALDGTPWNSGNTIFTSSIISASPTPNTDCNPSISGLAGYDETTLTIASGVFALKANEEYILEFISGFGASRCTSEGYLDGQAYINETEDGTEDLHFLFNLCKTDTISFGCNAPNHCNYDSTVDSYDGLCQTTDCLGICGGEAYSVADCGCVGGASGLTESDCSGCTDPNACNYAPTTSQNGSILPVFEDGSCGIIDCNGDCDGNAILTPCGCIHGQTGENRSCIEGCLTTNIGGNRSSCPPIFLTGQEFRLDENATIRRISLHVCCGTAPSFLIRELHPEHQCNPSAYWNQGAVIYQSATLPAQCLSTADCASDLSSFTLRNWVVNIPIDASKEYVLQFTSGFGIGACPVEPLWGNSFNDSGQLTGEQLNMEIEICQSDSNLIGCTDPDAAQGYSPSHLHDDGSCLYNDCNGIAGGNSQLIPGCGCIETSSQSYLIQCQEGEENQILKNDGHDCSTLAQGQTWTALATGYLTGFQFYGDTTQNIDICLIHADGPLDGDTIAIQSRAGGIAPNACTSDNNGWITFLWDSIPIQVGNKYAVESETPCMRGTCRNDYVQGYGYTQRSSPLSDVQFRLSFLEDTNNEILFGCLDINACNYTPNATDNNGDCYGFDCAGNCPNEPGYVSSYFVEGCGCIGANGVEEINCFGCTDSTACNFNPEALNDNGTCNARDCNGDCLATNSLETGLAMEDPTCGCIGGNTGLDASICNQRCQGSTLESTLGVSDEFSFYLGTGGIQSIKGEYSSYITGVKILQLTTPLNTTDAPFQIVIAIGNTHHWNSANILDTLQAKSYTPSAILNNYNSFSLYFEMDTVVELTDSTFLFIQLDQGNWQSPTLPFNELPLGRTQTSPYGVDIESDLFIEVYECDELLGCTNSGACNFDPWATTNLEGACHLQCTDDRALSYIPENLATCPDSSACEYLLGCNTSGACNYHPDAFQTHPITNEIIECVFPDEAHCIFCPSDTTIEISDITSDMLEHLDADNDGICDPNEISGCMLSNACNYNINATDESGDCMIPNACSSCSGATDGTGYLIYADDLDLDGLCNELDSCSDVLAYNFDSNPTEACQYNCNTLPNPLTITSVSVFGASGETIPDGEITITSTGGYGPLSEFQSHLTDLLNISDTVSHHISTPFTGLIPSVYEISITDAFGCLGTVHPDLLPSANGRLIQTSTSNKFSVGLPYFSCD